MPILIFKNITDNDKNYEYFEYLIILELLDLPGKSELFMRTK